MAFSDTGGMMRGATGREHARADADAARLETLLASGWSAATADQARRLHDELAHNVDGFAFGLHGSVSEQAALELVGEARGASLAAWWAEARMLHDDQVEALLLQCAATVGAAAMADGFRLGMLHAQSSTTGPNGATAY